MPFYALCVLPCVSLDQLPRSSRPHREELQGDAVLWPVVASHRQAATQFQTAERHLIFQQLNSHHSRDPLFLARLRKEMASMNPWRCKYCMRMVRPSSDLCGGCWGHWSVCYDATYVHKRHKKESQHKKRQQYSPEWNDASWEAPWREGDSPWKQSQKASHRGSGTQSPRHRSASAHQRQGRGNDWDPPDLSSGKGQGKGSGEKGEKGGAAAFGHMPPSTQCLARPSSPFLTDTTSSTALTSTSTTSPLAGQGQRRHRTSCPAQFTCSCPWPDRRTNGRCEEGFGSDQSACEKGRCQELSTASWLTRQSKEEAFRCGRAVGELPCTMGQLLGQCHQDVDCT